MRGAGPLALALALLSGAAGAEAPGVALRPEARPALPALEVAKADAFSAQAVAVTILPQPRPADMAGLQLASTRGGRGGLCGEPALQGESVAPVLGRGGCGIAEPVRVRAVDGVRLSDGALMDCATARALLRWVREGARPAIGQRGGGLAGIEVMGHYACRPRNNQAGARLSEHGRGHAIDVGALVLADGSRLSVLRDWPDGALRAMHRAACGPFSTVLGPAANAQHRDHFHFDTARGRGPYCR